MVVPFGVGVGDVIAVGRLAKKVVSELKNVCHLAHQIQTSTIKLEPVVLYADTEQTGEAASEYQAVQNELEALADTLDQITKIEPAELQLDQLNRIKAATKVCEAALQ